MGQQRSPYPYDDAEAQVAVFRAYQRLGTVEEVAEELGLTPQGVQKRLSRLYARIGAKNAIHASGLLQEAAG